MKWLLILWTAGSLGGTGCSWAQESPRPERKCIVATTKLSGFGLRARRFAPGAGLAGAVGSKPRDVVGGSAPSLEVQPLVQPAYARGGQAAAALTMRAYPARCAGKIGSSGRACRCARPGWPGFENTFEHRRWLDAVAGDLLAWQQLIDGAS